MPARHTRKVKKQRALTTHGWGAMKKHRGSGNRGGVGMAGSGKRGDQKKPGILKEFGNEYFGKHGFVRPNSKSKEGINLGDIQEKLNYFLNKGLIQQEKDTYIIKTKDIGYSKVLSQGNLKTKLKVYADSFSQKAIEKIEKAGGEAIVTLKKTKKPEEPKEDVSSN